jgi:hypothetical protein
MGISSSTTEAIAFPGQDRLLGALGETSAVLHKVQFGSEPLLAGRVETLSHFAVDLQDGRLVQVDVLGMGVIRTLTLGRSSASRARCLAVVGVDNHYLHRQTKADDLTGFSFCCR